MNTHSRFKAEIRIGDTIVWTSQTNRGSIAQQIISLDVSSYNGIHPIKFRLQKIPIVIDESNRWLDGQLEGFPPGSVALPIGNYESYEALGAAIPGGTLIVVTLDRHILLGNALFPANVSYLWKTGVHGSDNANNNIGSVLGFDTSKDSNNAKLYTSDYEIE